jgi:uroporphyrinogen decarboxylase
MLGSRERMLKALNHEETDRPPQDLGSTCNTSITNIAYKKILKYLGHAESQEPEFLSKDMQVVDIDELVLKKLHIDTRGIHANPPDNDRSERLSDDSYRDEWGIVLKAAKSNGNVMYYDVSQCPLASIGSVKEIESYNWPDPQDPGRTRALRNKAVELREKTPYAIVGHMGDTSVFQACALLRGMERFLIDLVTEKKFAHALMEKVLEIQSIKMEKYLDEVGRFLDVVSIGDDFCSQTGPLISPETFRTLIKPYLGHYCELIKRKTDAKLHLHSCGAVAELVPDLIEIGIDIINPVQLSAKGMDPVLLKKRFGQSICFWGGIDTQKILPFGTVEEVKTEVRRVSRILGKGGGYILNPVHNLQPDVPPENIVAMYDVLLE